MTRFCLQLFSYIDPTRFSKPNAQAKQQGVFECNQRRLSVRCCLYFLLKPSYSTWHQNLPQPMLQQGVEDSNEPLLVKEQDQIEEDMEDSGEEEENQKQQNMNHYKVTRYNWN
jgi:hypothetical protein